MDAGSSGERRGKQKVYWAAQLIGLMTDDSLTTAACDCFSLPPCAQALCNSGSHRQQRQSAVSLTQSCIVCIAGFVLTAFFKELVFCRIEEDDLLGEQRFRGPDCV